MKAVERYLVGDYSVKTELALAEDGSWWDRSVYNTQKTRWLKTSPVDVKTLNAHTMPLDPTHIRLPNEETDK